MKLNLNIKILIISVFCLLPASALATASMEDLKQQEEQVNLRIDLLQETVTTQQHQYEEAKNRTVLIRENILTIEQRLKESETRIAELSKSLDEEEQSMQNIKWALAETIRELAMVERTSAVTMLFQSDSFSDALRQIDHQKNLTDKISEQYKKLNARTEVLAAARDQLEMEKWTLSSARISLDLQYLSLRSGEEREGNLLTSSENLLTAARAEHRQVREQLFALAFDSNGQAINFEEATHFARLATQRVEEHYNIKLSPALLLALIRHESNFGNFLGRGHYASSMCSSGQINAFLQITQSLGLDPELMPVSRPAANQSCGGAMGYAQFLPLTWMGYAERVSTLTGNHPPSPWNPEDAFTASAIKLAFDGAGNGQTYAQQRRAQWEALMTYFSGSRWRNASILPNIRWYADNILQTMDAYKILIGE